MWCFCSRKRYCTDLRSVGVWWHLGLIMHWCCWYVSRCSGDMLFKCLRFLWYFWSSGVWTMHDLGMSCLLITVAGTHLFPCCNVTHHCWGVEALYHCVFKSKLSLSPFFPESVPRLLGLHVSLEDLHELVKMFSICGPWAIVQAISLFLLMACSCRSAEPCTDLVLSLRGRRWFELLTWLLHLLVAT